MVIIRMKLIFMIRQSLIHSNSSIVLIHPDLNTRIPGEIYKQ